jgi:hypothetical protein
MAEPLRILPPKGEESFPVFLPSGHSIRVYKTDPSDELQGSVIPSKFHKHALKAGCIYLGAEYEEDENDDQSGSENGALIIKAIEAIIERDEADDLDNTGKPTLKALKAQAGFNVTRAQANDAWDHFQDSLA